MKQWITIAVFSVVSAQLMAKPAVRYQVVDDTDAVIHINGDEPFIVIDGQQYWLKAGKDLYQVSKHLEAIIGTHKFHNLTKTLPGQAIGAIKNGAFRALVLEFPLPR